jgi:hypothetical protein
METPVSDTPIWDTMADRYAELVGPAPTETVERVLDPNCEVGLHDACHVLIENAGESDEPPFIICDCDCHQEDT